MNDESTEKKKPKIGVVLGSGGLKSMGAIELFDYFERENISIDLIVGCSGGAIVGAAKAIGKDSIQLRDFAANNITVEIFSKIDFSTLAGLAKLPFTQITEESAILKPDLFRGNQRKVYGNARFEELQIKTLIQTTDVHSGKGIVLATGDVADAVYASGALMPYLPPVWINEKLLADGGYSSTLPVVEAIKQGMDIVVAMSFEEDPSEKPSNLMEFGSHFLIKAYQNISFQQNAKVALLHGTEVIMIRVIFGKTVRMWDVDYLPMIYKTAREAVQAAHEQIKRAIEMHPVKMEREKRDIREKKTQTTIV